MKKQTDKFYILAITMGFIVMTFVIVICVLEIREMIIDHKCYMMEDEEFFNSEQCRPYWSYRRNK